MRHPLHPLCTGMVKKVGPRSCDPASWLPLAAGRVYAAQGPPLWPTSCDGSVWWLGARFWIWGERVRIPPRLVVTLEVMFQCHPCLYWGSYQIAVHCESALTWRRLVSRQWACAPQIKDLGIFGHYPATITDSLEEAHLTLSSVYLKFQHIWVIWSNGVLVPLVFKLMNYLTNLGSALWCCDWSDKLLEEGIQLCALDVTVPWNTRRCKCK